MPRIVPTSMVSVAGATSTAARRSEALNEALRRLPERPTIRGLSSVVRELVMRAPER
jgi:hypothetical protein